MTPLALIAPYRFGDPNKPVHILRTGKWHFPDMGEVDITRDDLKEIVTNFSNRVRRQDLPIVIEHNHDLGSYGWIRKVAIPDDDPDNLYMEVDWTDKGRQLILDDMFRYPSVELYRQYEDTESGKQYGNVLSATSLTNFPRIKDLKSMAAGETLPRAETVQPLSFSEILDELNAAQPSIPEFLVAFTSSEVETFSDDELLALLLAADDHTTPQSVRDKLPTSAFAFVKQRKILIHKPGNVRAGIGRFMQTQGVSESERDVAWGRLKRAAKKFGISTPNSWHDLGKSDKVAAAEIPTGWIGSILTRLGEPMDPNKGQPPTEQMATQFAEMQAKVTAMEAAFAEQKKAHEVALAELDAQKKLVATEKAARVALECSDVLDAAKREFRITPAQAEAYLAELPKMDDAARAVWIKDIKDRPPIASLSEVGSGSHDDSTTDETATRAKLADRQMAIFNEAKSKNAPISMREATLRASAELRGGKA